MQKSNLAIVIPIYRNKLEHNELISLQQALKYFREYDIFFLAPEGLKLKNNYGIKYLFFEKEFFESVRSYSRLMLTKDFYSAFSEYEYLLIYQLDAFVFSDGIGRFIDYGYDYIGAPTLEGMYKPYREEKVLFTQNGGFSLRRVNAFIKWCEDNKQEIKLMSKYDDEDSIIYALRHKGINMAPADIALEFSFDSNVEECFIRTDGKLPLGCHAWERYALEIWKPYIEKEGYVVAECPASRRIIKDYYHINEYNQKWINKYDSDILEKVLRNMLIGYAGTVYVWGMGRQGYDAMQLLLGGGVQIKSFLDTNIEKTKEGMYPCDAITVDAFLMEEKGPIIVAMYNHVDVCVFLEKQGFHHHTDYITYMELFAEFEIETMKE